ncbi:MAG: uL15 family ribosomal protein [Clostridia bacterium]|nr:uL15 family ribosomal protein [Clostridia bacterium]
MEFVNSILFSAGINIFNISVVSCAVIAVLCILVAVIAALIRCQVVYVDPEGDYEIEFEKKKWLSKVVLRPAFKLGKSFVGWSLDPKGENMVTEPEFMLTHTYVLYAIWKDETKVAKDGEGVFIQLNYLDAEGEDVVKSCIYKANTVLPENQEIGVKVNGWAFEKGGKAVLAGENASAVFSINLYPVFDEKSTSNVAFDGDVVCELLFIDSNTDSFIYKESHYFDLEIPEAWNTNSTFVGWAVEPNGEAIIERGDDDAVFTIQLFSVDGEVQAVLVDEPYVAPVAEEVAVEEQIPEEVVEEEIVEEPVAEEPVVEEPVVEEPVVEEPVAEEPVQEEPVQEEPVEIVPTVIPTYFDNEGNKIDIKYSRSFTANLIQSDDTVKDYYSQLKNHILSYKGVKSKISWKFDSYNRGRDQLFKIKFRGKTILLYCAIDPEELDKAKYHHEAINAKIFADVPTLLKVKSGLGLRKAKEVVDIVMAKFGIEQNPKAKTIDYVAEYPYEETEALLARKLVKILEADGDVVVVSTKEKEPEPVVEEPVIEEPVVEEPVVEEPVVEEPAQEEPVAEEPVAEEPVVEEPVVEEPAQEEEAFEIHEAIVEEVSSEEADKIAEEQHIDATMDEGIDYITAKDTKKVIVNIDSISKAYHAGEIVNIASLKEKKLIVKNAKFVKVLARGTLDKPLKIKAGEFSDTAIKMIRLVGGSPTHVKYVIKK